MWRPGRVRRRTGERSRKGGSREVVDEGVGRPRTRRGRQRLEPEEGITRFPYGTIGDPSHKHRAFNSVLIAERTCVGKKTFLTVPYSGVRIEGLKLAAINRRSTCSGQDRLCLSIFLRIKNAGFKNKLTTSRTPCRAQCFLLWKNSNEITSATQLEEFTMLFIALDSVELSEQKDTISWNWTKDGKFSVSSAYECQFLGAMSRFPTPMIWKATAEPRSKFFAWLVLHNKVLTTDNMSKRNWSCDPICSLLLYREIHLSFAN
jgi:hypothetical protein